MPLVPLSPLQAVVSGPLSQGALAQPQSVRCRDARLLPDEPLALTRGLPSLRQAVVSGPQPRDAIAQLQHDVCSPRSVAAQLRRGSVRLGPYEPLPTPLVPLSVLQTVVSGPRC